MLKTAAILAALPQTQCGECGFDGCMPYARALASNKTSIDRCPPGGVETLNALGKILKIDVTPYLEKVKNNTRKPSIARINEAECIGCTKCIMACPVDAIVGSAKSMHSIIAHECTGCGLCVEPCPVDCIEMDSIEKSNFDKEQAKMRFEEKKIRALKENEAKRSRYFDKKRLLNNNLDAKKSYILQALERKNKIS